MREYARQRGVHLNAVQTAVKTGRIHKTADGKIDVDAANKEWFMNTDPAKSHKTDPLFENPPEAMPVGGGGTPVSGEGNKVDELPIQGGGGYGALQRAVTQEGVNR